MLPFSLNGCFDGLTLDKRNDEKYRIHNRRQGQEYANLKKLSSFEEIQVNYKAIRSEIQFKVQ